MPGSAPVAPAPATRSIVFSHANGFPAGTYRLLFEQWRAAGWQVHALERFGHDARYPVTSNWPHLRDQLIHFIEAEVGGPAMLVGHSLGGLLSLLAASRRADLAAGVVMLDSPVLAGWRARALQAMKASRLIRRLSPGRVSQRRRTEWASRAEVLKHFANKAAFSRWDPRVLEDYAQAGFEERDGKTVLGFQRDIETRIYDTLPHHLGALLRRHPLACPLAFIGARESRELRQAGAASSRRLAGERFVWVDGSHLFPMEQPERTAALVLQLIDSFR